MIPQARTGFAADASVVKDGEGSSGRLRRFAAFLGLSSQNISTMYLELGSNESIIVNADGGEMEIELEVG